VEAPPRAGSRPFPYRRAARMHTAECVRRHRAAAAAGRPAMSAPAARFALSFPSAP